ncbi:WecB/TagA/CpsF family glycosyltransferase [Runella aurantiaca]|uniref:Glycosyltransferase n=1 Tax=Runella aurantiaca TaxID=2282308 RepID=A0A369IC08_9BACT|nr:WecB/TagA/CpsF family glycosyltransferase [Runella aurantiaca]RDB04734.1 glycosyltransferase [Runella aurantiaca]
MYKAKLLHANISSGTFVDFVQQMIQLGKSRTSTSVFVANVHMFIESKQDYQFGLFFNNADIVLPDGKPLCAALNFLYGIKQERVAGMDLMPILLDEASKSGVIVYFYGSTDDVLQKIREKCVLVYPSLKIGGMYSPPFRKLTADEDQKIINDINASGAGIVFVALGCPKQEKWMSAMKGRISSVMIGVGGAFPVFAGAQKRAPKWMQDASLEWLYRLIQEPRRLFKRYFVTNSLFIFMVLREKLRLSWFPSHT